jgi:hypothetical protein
MKNTRKFACQLPENWENWVTYRCCIPTPIPGDPGDSV